ncbi:MAG: NHLP leader peptide family natural product precursor [Parcubacteria group bacterium]|jgi:hypothetical protein|nr:NHLP leader peptide family natural product precursor [Parcubacteria group bacterium]|tara:strand:- start:1882 stop:2196 length:315 start_codon:yes stop_codon:yes gene_type:complete
MANGSREEAQKNYGKIVAKAWQDAEFKAKLMVDPKSVLKENGVEVPERSEVKIVENTDTLVHFTLPPKPDEGELDKDDLVCAPSKIEYGVDGCCTKWVSSGLMC